MSQDFGRDQIVGLPRSPVPDAHTSEWSLMQRRNHSVGLHLNPELVGSLLLKQTASPLNLRTDQSKISSPLSMSVSANAWPMRTATNLVGGKSDHNYARRMLHVVERPQSTSV